MKRYQKCWIWPRTRLPGGIRALHQNNFAWKLKKSKLLCKNVSKKHTNAFDNFALGSDVLFDLFSKVLKNFEIYLFHCKFVYQQCDATWCSDTVFD